MAKSASLRVASIILALVVIIILLVLFSLWWIEASRTRLLVVAMLGGA